MKVVGMLAAERAILTPEGRLDLLGVIRNLNAPGFPVRHEHLDLVIMLEGEITDSARPQDFRLELVSEDSRLKITEGSMSIARQHHGFDSDEFVKPLIISFGNLEFPEAGIYSFLLLDKGSCEARWDVRLQME